MGALGLLEVYGVPLDKRGWVVLYGIGKRGFAVSLIRLSGYVQQGGGSSSRRVRMLSVTASSTDGDVGWVSLGLRVWEGPWPSLRQWLLAAPGPGGRDTASVRSLHRVSGCRTYHLAAVGCMCLCLHILISMNGMLSIVHGMR